MAQRLPWGIFIAITIATLLLGAFYFFGFSGDLSGKAEAFTLKTSAKVASADSHVPGYAFYRDGGDGGGGDGGGGDGGGGDGSGGDGSGGDGSGGDGSGGDGSGDGCCGGDTGGDSGCCGGDTGGDTGCCGGDSDSGGDGSSGGNGGGEQPKGCLVITKKAFKANGQQISPVPPFTFMIDGTITVTTDANGFAQVNNLSVGQHTVTENVPSGWELASVSPANGVVNVVAGTQCVKVVFKNKKKEEKKPSCVITATPDHIVINEDPLLEWTSQNATSASLNQGIGTVSVNGSYNVFPQQTTTYTLTVSGPGGTAQCSVTVTVTTVTEEDDAWCDLNASRAFAEEGDTVTLSWDSEGHDQWITHIGAVSPSGSLTIQVFETITYILHVYTNLGTEYKCPVTITVDDDEVPEEEPFCDIWASDTHIEEWESTTLQWVSANAESATLTNFGSVAVDGSRVVSPDSTTTYTLTVHNDAGSSQCSVTIFVDEEPHEAPSCDIWASDTHIEEGDSVTLTWDSENASSASLSSIGSVGTDGSRTAYPDSTRTYTLTVWSDEGGSAQCRVTVVVEDDNDDHDDVSCDIYSAEEDDWWGNRRAVYLSWSSENADRATLSGYGNVPTDGSKTVYPTRTTTYTLTVWNDGETEQCSTTVYLDRDDGYDRPSCSIQITDYDWGGSGRARLSWWSSDAHHAYIEGVGSVNPNDSMTVYRDGQRVYRMTVSGPGGTATCHTSYVAPYLPPIIGQPYITLSQMPYTGFDFGPIGNAAYLLSIMLLALGGAYLLLQNRDRFAYAEAGVRRLTSTYSLESQYQALESVFARAAAPIHSLARRFRT